MRQQFFFAVAHAGDGVGEDGAGQRDKGGGDGEAFGACQLAFHEAEALDGASGEEHLQIGAEFTCAAVTLLRRSGAGFEKDLVQLGERLAIRKGGGVFGQFGEGITVLPRAHFIEDLAQAVDVRLD